MDQLWYWIGGAVLIGGVWWATKPRRPKGDCPYRVQAMSKIAGDYKDL
jgi:hypothetical protein